MALLIDCSQCRTALQLPPGAPSIRCSICEAVTFVSQPHNVQAVSSPPQPPLYSGYNYPLPGPWSQQAPPPRPPPIGGAGGRKKAVICGISYRNTWKQLGGCLNDTKCMRHLLVSRFCFLESNIVMLTEEENDPDRIPTKYNIMRALYWLIQGCQPGDSLVFHYSGHGSQRENYYGDEVDGMDETLLPLDFETQGMIIDDEINAAIVKPLPHGVKLHAIIDACHSGTVLDLPYLCRMDWSGRYVWEDHRPPNGAWKGTSGGEVISFSGCDDNQKSADTLALSKVAPTGAMTYCFIEAIVSGWGTTYASILNYMRSRIRNTKRYPIAENYAPTLSSMLNTGGISLGTVSQEPQLTSSEKFDPYTKPFVL